ncbi:hypothetical protein JXB12_08975 [candidate division KSB1 bacterium]|nr:hypothetical protein [candidate division KSB1 bacterium]
MTVYVFIYHNSIKLFIQYSVQPVITIDSAFGNREAISCSSGKDVLIVNAGRSVAEHGGLLRALILREHSQ